MNRMTVVALGLLVLVTLILLLVGRQAPAPRQQEEPSAEASAPAAEAPTAAAARMEQARPDATAEAAPDPARPTPQRQEPSTATHTPTSEGPAEPASQPEVPQEPPRASGPIEELKARLKSDPRDARAHEYEELIRRSFREKDVPEGLLESALCKKSVCRVSLRWAPDRHMGTMAGLMRLIPSFAEHVAFDPAATANRTGETAVDVYFARKPEE